MKTASHEMKSLMRFRPSFGLKLPLMCTIDYRGYRLVCMSILPLGKRAYGCADASNMAEVAFTKIAHNTFRPVAESVFIFILNFYFFIIIYLIIFKVFYEI